VTIRAKHAGANAGLNARIFLFKGATASGAETDGPGTIGADVLCWSMDLVPRYLRIVAATPPYEVTWVNAIDGRTEVKQLVKRDLI
jgi:hypothetical protein